MLKLTSIIYLAILLVSCGQANNRRSETENSANAKDLTTNATTTNLQDTTKPIKQKIVNKYYPFELQEFDGQFNIVANIESEDLYPKYYDLFQKHGYEGNGYCWDGHITQILEKLEFNPDGRINTEHVFSMHLEYNLIFQKGVILNSSTLLFPCAIKNKLAFAKLETE